MLLKAKAEKEDDDELQAKIKEIPKKSESFHSASCIYSSMTDCTCGGDDVSFILMDRTMKSNLLNSKLNRRWDRIDIELVY